MMKTGATAVLAAAALAGSAAAQDTCAPLWSQCLGPEPANNVPCCSSDEAVACVQKNAQYAQCRPANEVGTSVPLGWMGDVLTTPTTIAASGAATADAEADVDGEAEEEPLVVNAGDVEADDDDEEADVEQGPIVDAEDVVEMGAAPAGMDAEDVEEMGMTEELAKELDPDAQVVKTEDDAEHVQEQVVVVGPGETTEEAADAGDMLPVAGDDTASEEAVDQFINFPGFDYLPNGSNIVEVQDLVPSSMASMKVTNPQACEDFCSATEGCNAASYYLDGSTYGDKNCWLKTIASPCEKPADAMPDPNAVLLLKLDDTCEAALAEIAAKDNAMAPAGFAEDDAVAPISDDTGAELPDETPEDLDNESRSFGDTAADLATVNSQSSDGTVSVRGALIAMAVAGASAFF